MTETHAVAAVNKGTPVVNVFDTEEKRAIWIDGVHMYAKAETWTVRIPEDFDDQGYLS